MKVSHRRFLFGTASCALALSSALAFYALAGEPCCNVVFVDVAKGMATVRNRFTGRIMQVRDAELVKTLSVGDEIEADAGMMQIVSVKGLAKMAALVEPAYEEPCCSVVGVVKDKAAAEALIAGMFAEPTGDPAEPVGSPRPAGADPINSIATAMRSRVRGADTTKGIQAEGFLDGAEPINGIVVARDLTTGAMHVLNLSVQSQQVAGGVVGSAITDSVSLGDKVAIDVAGGFGVIRGKDGTYGFPLRGVKSARAKGASGVEQWQITPNAEMKGMMGQIVTNFPELTDSSNRIVTAFTPGTKETVSQMVLGEKHVVPEGEYDVQVMQITVPKVPVKRGHDTRILIGALAFAGRPDTAMYIFDAKGEKQLVQMIATSVMPLPVGTYSIKAGSRVIRFEIKDGEVTEL